MKILKYLIIVIAVLVAAFFAVGIIHPVVQYGHEVTVNKPLKEAWAVGYDESKYDQWLQGFQSMELLTGEKGEVGSTYKVIVNPGDGQPDFEMIETMVSVTEFEQVTLHFDSEMMDFDQTMTYTEKDGGVVIKTDSKVMAKGMVMKSMMALMEHLSGAFTTQEAKNIDALKRVIEENTTDYYPVMEVPVVEPITEQLVTE